jgi:hypothetical protein
MRSLPFFLGLCALLTLAACDTEDTDDTERLNARNDTAQTGPGQAVTIDVLGNDDGVDVRIEDFDAVTDEGGTVTEVGDELRYTPVNDFIGSDTFTYTATDDSGDTDEATVTVIVEASGNSAPVANDNAAQTIEGQPVTIDVLANDTDPDGDALTIGAFDATSAGGGTVELVGEQLRYTPADGFTGTDSLTYVAEDDQGLESNTATVTITVKAVGNNPPNASNDTAQVTAGQAVNIDLLANDTDPDGDDLDLAQIGKPTGGSFTRVDTETGEVRYLAPADPGTYTFDYVVTDGEDTDTATVTVTVK